MRNFISRFARPRSLTSLVVGLTILVGLFLVKKCHSYVLFHSLAEVFSIVVAFGIFTVFWNSRRFLDNGCFLFLGIAYLFVGGIDLLHTLAYKDMGVFEGDESGLATQLWIGGRYVESLSILAAPLFLHRRFNPYLLLSAYAVVAFLLLGSIFFWKVFPTCFVEGEGLTPFKRISEYVICLILIASLVLLFRRRSELDVRVYELVSASILLTVASEVAFTLYTEVTGTANMIGHFLKLVSFYLIYVAFVEVAFTNPYAVLFRNLKESEESLRRSESRFRGTFENAAVGMAHVDLDGRWLRVNQKLCEIVGYSREEILQKTFRDLTHGQDLEADLAQFSLLVCGQISSYSTENRYVRRNGRVVWVNLTMAIQRDEAGNPLYAIAAVQDITKRKDAEQQLKAVNETLERRVADRTSLAEQRASQLRVLASELTLAEQRERRRLAQVLHDHLQQLLVTAKLKLGILRRRAGNDAPEQSLQQVDDLLDQAIGASRSLTIELSPPILYDAGLAAALEWLARQMEAKHGLAVEVEADPEAAPVTEDLQVLIFQAVRELLFNVVKHARAESARVEMTQADDQQVRVSVTDTGVGFDPSKFQTDGLSDTGFGLFSVQERLGLLGGRLEIDATPGRGTRASIFAPRLRSGVPIDRTQPTEPALAASPERDAASPRTDHRPPGDTRTIRVLLADDHELVREGLLSLLRDQPDLEVVGEASDGEAAVELALQTRPDVVVMDVAMPRLSGVEATRRITAAVPGVGVIGLSMHEQADMAQAMRQAGAVAYLPKDGPAEELVAAIRDAASSDLARRVDAQG